MFKIGDEVMDKDGRQYTVLGIGAHTYEIRDENGITGLGDEYHLAKYDPVLGPSLIKIAEGITRVEGLLLEVRTLQINLFEKARQQT